MKRLGLATAAKELSMSLKWNGGWKRAPLR